MTMTVTIWILFQFKQYLVPQTYFSCLEVLEKFMLQPNTIGASTTIASNMADNSDLAQNPARAVANILGIKDLGTIFK